MNISDKDTVGRPPFLIWHVLSVARAVGGLVDPKKIGEMDKELTKVIEDLDRVLHIRGTLRARV